MINNSGLTIIGAGRMGGALAIALEKRGWKIENIVSRRIAGVRRLAAQLQSETQIFTLDNLAEIEFSNVVLITTPDPEIELTAQRLAQIASLKNKNAVFLHTSGSLSSEVLTDLRAVNGKIGSLHPLVSISDAGRGAANFGGKFFCLEGDAEAVAVASQIVAALDGSGFSIPTESKTLYHAAAVIAAGHLVALFDAAAETLADCGLPASEARKILLPLVRSAVENLAEQTPAQALTGTFARADIAAMQKHLAALKDKNALSIYIELGKQSLKLALEQGADAAKIAAMRRDLKC